MASHLHLSTLQSTSNISRAKPWLVPQTKQSHLSLSLAKRTTDSLHAQGRGFGLTTVSDNKPNRESNDSNDDNESQDEEDAIPEVVFNQMQVRTVLLVGVPMASGVGLLNVLRTLKEQGVWESPGWVPFLTLLLAFGTSALGIAYRTLSTSWDPESEGTWLGLEVAQKNWPELWKEEEEGQR